MLKVGVLTRHSEGVYTILPYSMFVLNKLVRALKRAMNKLKAKEVLMPCATSVSVFAKSLRARPEMFMLTNNNMVLAPTAEDIALQLPNALALSKLYQIQLKFRNELRPGPSLIRGCEFIMKDCYMLFNNKCSLLAEFKRALTEYKLLFKTLGVRPIFAIGDSKPLSAQLSFEFVAPCVCSFNTSCYSHVHTLTLASARYLSFTEDYVVANKVLISESYLRLTGLELAHTFVFGKLANANNWFASLGVGVSRLLGHLLRLSSKNFSLLAVCNTVIINSALALCASGYARYIYFVLRCTTLSCVLFEANVHNNVLLGLLKRLPPRLIVFANVPLHGFLVRAQPQTFWNRALKQTHSLQFVLTLAHTLESTRIR